MRLLLDTHVLLWWLADDARLRPDTRDAIADGDNEVAVSAATVWEVAIKGALGRLSAPEDLIGRIDTEDFTPWPMTFDDAQAAGELPGHHDDPFDRMLIAQARQRRATLASVDPSFGDYEVQLLRT